MSRQKISEFTAKTLLYPVFSLEFQGMALDRSSTLATLSNHFDNTNLVLKIDQGIKKRGKLGLVKVNLTPSDVVSFVKQWSLAGWTNFLVEPMVEHDQTAEHYLSLTLTRNGWQTSYSLKGGIDVESHWDQLSNNIPTKLANFIHTNLIPALEQNHIVFLEINPILIRGDRYLPLDMAVEVDTAGSHLLTVPDRVLAQSEKEIINLDNSTPASLKFRLINPAGRIWMLLSGGGASLVLADEVSDLGLGSELANYGEYSGAPTDDDVYSYTKIILKQLLSTDDSRPQAIVIAGGVANFTDVAKTFHGIIRALKEQLTALQKKHVKIFVRRGGPNELAGLKQMISFLTESGLLGSVYGHETNLTTVISDVKSFLTNNSGELDQ